MPLPVPLLLAAAPGVDLQSWLLTAGASVTAFIGGLVSARKNKDDAAAGIRDELRAELKDLRDRQDKVSEQLMDRVQRYADLVEQHGELQALYRESLVINNSLSEKYDALLISHTRLQERVEGLLCLQRGECPYAHALQDSLKIVSRSVPVSDTGEEKL